MSARHCLLCDDEQELLTTTAGPTLRCPACATEYLDCVRCAATGGCEIDFLDNDKGTFCERCERHFCATCWQNTGEFARTEEWVCEDCRK